MWRAYSQHSWARAVGGIARGRRSTRRYGSDTVAPHGGTHESLLVQGRHE
jgi:hypothetical protein